MATFTQISEVRLRIDDPPGAIVFVEVANQAAVPDPPVSQTGYKALDTGLYYVDDRENPAKLYVSDVQISAWIDAGSVECAVYYGIRQILGRVGKELTVASVKTGTEDISYTSLSQLQRYYESLLEDAKNDCEGQQGNNSGRVGTTDQPTIAGANL